MLISLLAIPVAWATTFAEVPSLDTLARTSDAVIQGEVIGSNTDTCSVGLCTTHTILVQHVWTGTVGDIVEVTLPGGHRDGLTQRVSGVPLWDEGVRVVLFMKQGEPVSLTSLLTVTDDDRTHDPLNRSFIPSTIDELTAFVRERHPGRLD